MEKRFLTEALFLQVEPLYANRQMGNSSIHNPDRVSTPGQDYTDERMVAAQNFCGCHKRSFVGVIPIFNSWHRCFYSILFCLKEFSIIFAALCLCYSRPGGGIGRRAGLKIQ
jgi:hypothetical protein